MLSLPFRARGHDGIVSVSVTRNDRPLDLGCDTSALGFPVCSADVAFGARGYDAVLGWVQLVEERRESASDRRFLLDPLQIFEGVDTPFGWYGIAPTFFDAPSRRDRRATLDWLAHSFLCFSPTAPMRREVQPLTGFSWGFTMTPDRLDLIGPVALTPPEWDRHLGLLSAEFPRWQFLSWGPVGS